MGTRSLRVYIAGAQGAPISNAAVAWAKQDPRVVLAGFSTRKLDKRELSEAEPDLLISAAHHFFIRGSHRATASVAAIGLHPSLLPKYRGSYPLWWALRNNESRAGLTAFILTDGVDEGPILVQEEVAISPDDTFSTLYERLAGQVPSVLSAVADMALEGVPLQGRPQDESAASYYSSPTKRSRAAMKAFWWLRRRVYAVRRWVPGTR